MSEPFTFLVGATKTPVVAPAALIASVSEPMDRLINGGMSEAERRCAEIPDVEVDDFVRFVEYTFHGDYTVPECGLDEEPNKNGAFSPRRISVRPNRGVFHFEALQPQPVNAGYEDDVWRSGFPCTKKKKGKEECAAAPPMFGFGDMAFPPNVSSPSQEPKSVFSKLQYDIGKDAKVEIRDRFVPKSNTSAEQNFTPVFLAHARLYTFARVHLMDSLISLTLQKLHRTLAEFQLHECRVKDVLALARYAYACEDIPSRGEDGTIDELRKLIIRYIVCQMEDMGGCDEFVELLEEGGEFVGDFWRNLTQQVK